MTRAHNLWPTIYDSLHHDPRRPREHLFACPGGICRYIPVTSYYAGGRVPSRVPVCLPCIFSRMMSLSTFIGGARRRLAEENHAGQNALRPWQWYFFVYQKILLYFVQRVDTSKRIFMYFNKKCDLAIRKCHQANCDNRHLVPHVPIGLVRVIRDMPIVCVRTHPDANKHVRHTPMYRPAHSAHTNKCSLCFVPKYMQLTLSIFTR